MKLKRKSIRLTGYDYAQPGAYYVTICAHNHQHLFGEIVGGEMQLNSWGMIVRDEWLKSEQLRPNIKLDEFIVMPNHMHGIIHIVCRGVLQYAPTNAFRSPSQTIGSIIRGFKSAVTYQINKIHNTQGYPIWQRNYYEHVIRNEHKLNEIRYYIQNNPLMWDFDENNR